MVEIFSGAWSEALVWTLIHSLWQGLIVLIVLAAIQRFIPVRLSSARYFTAVIALSLFVVSSVVTYTLVYSGDPSIENTGPQISTDVSLISGTFDRTAPDIVTSVSETVYDLVESNLYVIGTVWMIGALLFSLRMVSGFFYISSIRKNALPVGEECMQLLLQLTERLGLVKPIRFAESSLIKVPFVVGFFRPIILMPAGMLSGLSAQQLEAILVHELMHIKRNDYIVNVVQSVVESVFFFNPFVWIISSIIRREREHCCDDEVVKHGDPLSYAYALARIEENNLKHVSPALSLAENNKHLLQRIKRIMEKSVQNYSVKERIVPLVLLIVGLICASWFSIRPTNVEETNELPGSPVVVAGDTTKPGEKSKSYSEKRTTVTDREGNTIELAEVEGDEELAQAFDFSFNYDFTTPPEPPEPFEPLPMISPVPPIKGVAPLPPLPFSFEMDSVPVSFFHSDDNWETFSEEFQSMFKEKFGDFYKQHGAEMDKMMKELGENFKHSFNEEMLEEIHREAERAQQLAMRHMQSARKAMEYDSKRFAEQAELERARADEHHKMLQQHEKELQKHHEALREHERVMEKFQKEFRDELVKDGYLNKDEHIANMTWKDGEKIEVNGKAIRKEHAAKYHDLHRKYFKRGGSFFFVD